jgi:hypothetical protein
MRDLIVKQVRGLMRLVTRVSAGARQLWQAKGEARHQLTVDEPEPSGNYVRVKSHAYFWGLYVPKAIVARECVSDALDEVCVMTSLPQALATVLTLGIWMPATIEYKCRASPAEIRLRNR